MNLASQTEELVAQIIIIIIIIIIIPILLKFCTHIIYLATAIG